ncbi:anthranilate synthase component I family protein [Nesterenkonia alba]|uniref:anthranilate synthase component I family protein n=1 Tax=Nesterenkonia alba TaxID=515814 RepID=UPI00040AC6AC|nr:anthranilate synthase component I family protein [Nesterenkonia alba]
MPEPLALFRTLAGQFPSAPKALLYSADHTLTPRPERSRYSILAFSLGQRAAVVHQQDYLPWLKSVWPGGDDWAGTITYEGAARFFRVTHAVVVDHHTGDLSLRGTEPVPTPQGQRAWGEVVATAQHTASPPSPSATPERGWEVGELHLRDGREQYLEKIRRIQEQITAGTTYEACLTTAVTGQIHTADTLGLFTRLVEANRAPFTQYLMLPHAEINTVPKTSPGPQAAHTATHDDAGVTEILSTSPERFLSLSASGLLRTEPMKGTRARGATGQQDAALAEDLRTHPKDRAENIMIADLARNDLSVHAVPGSLRTERLCAVETYPTVHQMVSTVSARLSPQAHPADAVAAAFPPGSMTGAPKISTVEILAGLEGQPRGPYAGAAGYFFGSGEADLSVLIRTLVLTRTHVKAQTADMHLGLGGAITADSDPQAEWEEIITKSRGVLGVLGAEFPAEAVTRRRR